jgi:hypothetical protein
MKLISRWELILAVALIAFPMISADASHAAINSLPNSAATPGALNPGVRQENIQETICVKGYTATIRPPVSYTNSLKRIQLNSPPYSSYGSSDLKLFEEDHLIALELGGSPTSVKNLWPEPWVSPLGAHDKDRLENKLHALVCSGSIPLTVAQKAIASNWQLAFNKYVMGVVPASPLPSAGSTSAPPLTPTGDATTTPAPAPSPTSSRPTGSTGLCKDGSYSFAATHKGMCSRHGGVAQFYP